MKAYEKFTMILFTTFFALALCLTCFSCELDGERDKFDTSALESWCGSSEVHSVRMVGAEVYRRDKNQVVVKDEDGSLWILENVDVDDNDFLLLWIDDMDTLGEVEDDVVVKVWREVH